MTKPDALFDRKLAAIFQAEAAEHVHRMQGCLAELEHPGGAASADKPLELLFRAVHSLKGAARAVGEDEVEAVCHATESVLVELQRSRIAWSPALADVLHEVVRGLERALSLRGIPPGALVALVPQLERLVGGTASEPGSPRVPPALGTSGSAAREVSAPAAAAAPPQGPADSGPTMRIPVERVGDLLYQIEELVAAKLQAGHHLTQLDEVLVSFATLRAETAVGGGQAARSWQQYGARLQALRASALRQQRQLAAAVDALLRDVKETLLQPVGSLRPFLVATVRELARSQQKDVELRIRGDEVEIDRRLLEALREPLVHLLRNAIHHGLERPQERLAAGKPAKGLVEVAITARNGGRVEISVSDDGAGVDTRRLAEVARAQQLSVPAAEDNPAELLPLVFGRGISTAAGVTTVSGRGLGLAIARDTVERLGGNIAIASMRGQGTTFTIALTTSLATYRAVEVQASGRSFLLPTARVERGLRVAPVDLRTLGGRQAVAFGDQDLPLASLAGLLGLPASVGAPNRISCLVLVDGGRRIALAVDEIRGEQEVLGKPVDVEWTHSAVVAGAALLGTGRMAPILNVPELVRTALREGGRNPGASVTVAARARGRSVLVAEDSITSRTLLKNILELAGHRVEVAVDGAEALARLRDGGIDVVVSDVEMPRLDGIGLTQAIRGDPALAHLPVILVTSLASPSDRERGAEAGANAYLVKSSFDQGNLLEAIAELA